MSPTLRDLKRDFFLTELFVPVTDKLNANGVIETWERTLQHCESYYNLNKKSVTQKAVNDGLSNDVGSVDAWIIPLCHAAGQSRRMLRTALAEDGFKIITVKFSGIRVTNDPDLIEAANNDLQIRVSGLLEGENLINEILGSESPRLHLTAG